MQLLFIFYILVSFFEKQTSPKSTFLSRFITLFYKVLGQRVKFNGKLNAIISKSAELCFILFGNSKDKGLVLKWELRLYEVVKTYVFKPQNIYRSLLGFFF